MNSTPQAKTSCVDNYRQAIDRALRGTLFSSRNGVAHDLEPGLERWVAVTQDVRKRGATIFLIGNGASATMASHMALDATKNAGIKSLAFNDPAYLTAISNDIDYQSVFSLPVDRLAAESDVLLAISSSGSSPNIVRAMEKAHEKGMFTVTLTGMSSGNPVRNMGDLNFYVPATTYGIVECCHQILLHCWLDRLMGVEPQ